MFLVSNEKYGTLSIYLNWIVISIFNLIGPREDPFSSADEDLYGTTGMSKRLI